MAFPRLPWYSLRSKLSTAAAAARGTLPAAGARTTRLAQFRSQARTFASPSPAKDAAFRRSYYIDRYHVRHFKPRGPARWFHNPRVFVSVLVVGAGVVVTVYVGNLETVPYTHRKHFILLSQDMEKRLGESEFDGLKKQLRGKILPPIHPECIRVKMIAADIIMALKRGIDHRQGWRDLEYSNEGYGYEGHGGSGSDDLRALREGEKVEVQWGKADEVLDDRWVEDSRKRGKKRGEQAMTGHLDGLKWEVVVVQDPMINALCLPGGKIVVFTGLLDNFRSDAEIATVLGHEIGHCIARHGAEGITKNMWFAIVQIVLFQFVPLDIANTMSHFLLRLPFSRRMEIEADYIGLLLMAAAGYDPRIAPKVYEKLGQLTGESVLRDYLTTHPSGKTRAKLLTQARVMEEALAIYGETLSGHGVEGFL